MKTIERIVRLLAFLSPAVLAWFVCPWLIRHGSSSAFDLAFILVVVATIFAGWGFLTFASGKR